jgi:hypothetical protein
MKFLKNAFLSFFSFLRALVMALNLMEERSQFGFYEGRGFVTAI